MEFLGSQFIGAATSKEGESGYRAVNPATGKEVEPQFTVATSAEVDRAVRVAREAMPALRTIDAERTAEFLDRIAEEIEGLGDELIQRAMLETGLPEGRLLGERGRTCAQLRLFAKVVREGSWVDARIDRAIPDREPAPKPDLRRMLVAMGPVVVFGASNFPLAFSVAGGDTASALAAGNSVVVKAHPAHPGTSEFVARAIGRAVAGTGMPKGVFSMVHGFEAVGRELVTHSLVEAVAFTGSYAGGKALFDLAAQRERPIPVFAEMGSINPVFVLPGGFSDVSGFAQRYVASLTLGCGQFCTNPGLVVGLSGEAMDTFEVKVAELVGQAGPGVMLTPGISKSYWNKAEERKQKDSVSVVAEAAVERNGVAVGAGLVFSTSAAQFMSDPDLHTEVFGPSALFVHCDSPEEVEQVAKSLEGQLTASVFFGEDDRHAAGRLLAILEGRAGRLLANGFPTGVEVCPSMHHGGPFPSTTDSRFTSVGTAAIYRFARPVCYQDLPQDLLPPELLDENPRRIRRMIDGVWTRKSV